MVAVSKDILGRKKKLNPTFLGVSYPRYVFVRPFKGINNSICNSSKGPILGRSLVSLGLFFGEMGMLCWRPNICKCHDKSCSDEKKTNLQKKSKILVKDPELSLFFHFHLRQIGSKSDSAVLSLLKKYQRDHKKSTNKTHGLTFEYS